MTIPSFSLPNGNIDVQVSYTGHKKEEENRSQHQWLCEHEYWVEFVVDLRKNMPKKHKFHTKKKKTVRKSRELLQAGWIETHTHQNPPRTSPLLCSKVEK